MNYQNQAVGDIGALLRLIQEEKAGAVLNQPPASESGAPAREVVQQPLLSPEAPGSARTVSTPPEAGQSAPSAAPSVVPPVPPVAPVAPVAAVAPIAPAGSPAPSAPAPSAPRPSAPAQMTLGTKITATPAQNTNAQNQQLLSVFNSIFRSPTPTRIGSPIVFPQVAKPTPTPTPKLNKSTTPTKNPNTKTAWLA